MSIDLEALLARDSAGLVAFVRAVRADLPAGDLVGVDITNYTKAAQYAAAGYDLRGLGEAANEITLMAYDEHGPWEPHPGPVGSLAWTRAGLRIVLASIPAAEIDLGAAGYGYVWGPKKSFQVGDEQARATVAAAGATPKFRAALGEWTAKLRGGATIWWSDRRSLALKARIALEAHLHGMAVWSLGLSDPIAPIPMAGAAGDRLARR